MFQLSRQPFARFRLGHQIDTNIQISRRLRRRGANRREMQPGIGGSRGTQPAASLKKITYGVLAGENHPIKFTKPRQRRIERRGILRRSKTDHRE